MWEQHIVIKMKKIIFNILSISLLLGIFTTAYGMNIYVGNLPHSVTDEELRELFREYGEVSQANIITDRYSGQSRGFGFVEMPQQADAEEAIKAMNGSELKGRNLKVNQARPRNERPQRRPRY
jgi:RNA recognition motif-containing protein